MLKYTNYICVCTQKHLILTKGNKVNKPKTLKNNREFVWTKKAVTLEFILIFLHVIKKKIMKLMITSWHINKNI